MIYSGAINHVSRLMEWISKVSETIFTSIFGYWWDRWRNYSSIYKQIGTSRILVREQWVRYQLQTWTSASNRTVVSCVTKRNGPWWFRQKWWKFTPYCHGWSSEKTSLHLTHRYYFALKACCTFNIGTRRFESRLYSSFPTISCHYTFFYLFLILGARTRNLLNTWLVCSLVDHCSSPQIMNSAWQLHCTDP
jgi:hypothetical protein